MQGWRQPDGRPWADNEIVSVTSDTLGIDDDLLIAKVTFRIDDRGGRTTTMELGPPAGYAPDPAQVRLCKHKGKRGRKGRAGKGKAGASWVGAGGIT